MIKNTTAVNGDQRPALPTDNRTYKLSSITFFILTFFSFYYVLRDLAHSIIGNELAQHAPLVFGIVLFLLYRDRKALRQLFREKSDNGSVFLFLTGLSMNVSGQILGIMYLSQLSFPLTIYGMILYLHGPLAARRLIFPLFFMLFAFPIPGKIYFEVVFPLKLFVTKAATIILAAVGQDVKSEGNIIKISSTVIGVSDACSGLNSLMAMLTLSIFYTKMTLRRTIHKSVVILLMFPTVMAVNVVRVVATCLIAVTWGDELASGKLHTFWGIFVFTASVLGMLALTNILIRRENREAENG
ncbi:MAG: exosortase/archaeosortase family protein [Syntrophales bacterium]|jgi:exosortase|nr:exosortase/archaeosortase family protein [Syntrophales bacterium]